MQKDRLETKKNKSFTLRLKELIVEGINILRQTKNLVDSLANVHRRYILWVGEMKDFLNNEELVKKIDISRFYEADSVPDIFPGGIEYSNIESENFQELLKNIRFETHQKLDHLREIQKTLEVKEGGKFLIPSPIIIKNASLDKSNYILEINNGEKIISFKSRKKGEGLEKETKQFKILYHLWDFHWEMKNNKVIKKGDYASLDNLMKGSGSESEDAAYKHIQRLNSRFKKEGVAIEIKGENKKYRLIINKV